MNCSWMLVVALLVVGFIGPLHASDREWREPGFVVRPPMIVVPRNYCDDACRWRRDHQRGERHYEHRDWDRR